MNKRHKNIKFSFETEKDNSFSFLDVKNCRKKVTASVFRKDRFIGVKSNFSSFVALEDKFGLVYTLFRRSFTLVSNFSKFHFKVETLEKKTLLQQNLLTAVPAKFVNNIFIQKPAVTIVLKLELKIALPYLAMEYFQYHQKETEQMHWYKRFKFYKLKKLFFKQVADSKIILNLRIVFLKLTIQQ